MNRQYFRQINIDAFFSLHVVTKRNKECSRCFYWLVLVFHALTPSDFLIIYLNRPKRAVIALSERFNEHCIVVEQHT